MAMVKSTFNPLLVFSDWKRFGIFVLFANTRKFHWDADIISFTALSGYQAGLDG